MCHVLIRKQAGMLIGGSLACLACAAEQVDESEPGATQDTRALAPNDDGTTSAESELPAEAPQVIVQAEGDGSYVVIEGPTTDATEEETSRSHVKFGDLLDVWAKRAFTWSVFERDGAVRSEVGYTFVDESSGARREFGLRFYYAPDEPAWGTMDLSVRDAARDRAVGWADGDSAWMAGTGSLRVVASTASNGAVPAELTVTLSDVVMVDATGASSSTLPVGSGSVVGEVTLECLVAHELDTKGVVGEDGASAATVEVRADVAWESEFCQRAKAELGL